LRREDIAQLCGISATWYAWIEQGRATTVSAQTLDALAHGLQLSTAERAYLFKIAGCTDPTPPPPRHTDVARLAELTDAIRAPAYIIDEHWDALAWNRAAGELFTDWLGSGSRRGARRRHSDAVALDAHPNLLRYVFLHPRAQAFIIGWEERARRLVAEYRADTPTWREDPRHEGLVSELSAASPAFATAWRSQRVLARDGGTRCFQHPSRGRCEYQQHILRLAQQPGLRLTVLTPSELPTRREDQAHTAVGEAGAAIKPRRVREP
jgi:transcriptional regulator with XRE-family HTH domain